MSELVPFHGRLAVFTFNPFSPYGGIFPEHCYVDGDKMRNWKKWAKQPWQENDGEEPNMVSRAKY